MELGFWDKSDGPDWWDGVKLDWGTMVRAESGMPIKFVAGGRSGQGGIFGFWCSGCCRPLGWARHLDGLIDFLLPEVARGALLAAFAAQLGSPAAQLVV